MRKRKNEELDVSGKKGKLRMPNCLNPECQKELPDGKYCCDEICSQRYFELKRTNRQNPSKNKKKPDRTADIDNRRLFGSTSEWVGQDRARNTMNTILKICLDLCPAKKEILIAHMRYRTGLSWRKIEEDYFRTLCKIGAIHVDGNNLVTVTELGKTLYEQQTRKPD
ncbi:MAG: hypothetical protein ACW98W_12655 [Candidatus Hodarchaeales archaeon]|jgi:predicted transcriptional regulator